MKKKFVGYLVFFLVLFISYLFFVFSGNDNWKKTSPVISYVKPFRFITQDSLAFTEKDMQGRVCLVNYFFTSCKGICPRMNNNLHKLYEEFKDEPDFLILSHTCDPERDTVKTLKKYADSLKVDERKWVFVTGRKDSLYNMARNSYLLDDPKNSVEKIEDQFLHTQFFALVDKNGQVRGQVFDGLKQDELNKLKEAISNLLKEKVGNSNFSNGIFTNNPQ